MGYRKHAAAVFYLSEFEASIADDKIKANTVADKETGDIIVLKNLKENLKQKKSEMQLILLSAAQAYKSVVEMAMWHFLKS